MKLVILVSAGTASAAKVLAAGLRDTTVARSIQTFIKLSDTEGVVIPAASLESLHGTRLNKGSGLLPDVTVPPAERNDEDAAYTKAVELLIHN